MIEIQVNRSSMMSSQNNNSNSLVEKQPESKIPIIYHDIYNISFMGLEKLHPFDSCKWGRIINILLEKNIIEDKQNIISPNEATTEILRKVHTDRYLSSLNFSITVAAVTEVAFVALIPNFLVQKYLLKPLRYQTGGTVLASHVAVERGCAINVGGGFHHCSSDSGGGFCAYADITLAIKLLLQNCEEIKKVMIVDLDAHQGNGHARDFKGDENIYIMDVYNSFIYPNDQFAKGAIKKQVELDNWTKDGPYLELVKKNLEEALDEFTPDFILYNAGTDVLVGDPLGCLDITAQGIIKRDEIVFRAARGARKIPIAMVTSGGYQSCTAAVIADSITNLKCASLFDGFL